MATPAGDSIPQVDTAAVNGLIQGGSWEVAPGVRAHALTYSFSVETDLGPDIGWTPALQNAVRGAFAAWSAVANLTFQEVDGGVDVDSSPAQIALVPTGDLLGQATEGQLIAIGYFPDPVAVDALIGETGRAESPNAEGDLYFDSATAPFDFVSPGGVGLTVFLHEIGHTLGLKHPYDDGHNGRPTISTDASVTVMALGAPGSVISSPATGNASTPLVDDIRAIQYIYGANNSYHTGNDVYQLRADGVRRAIWDAGGTDTFDATAAPIGLTIDLAEGASVDILSKSSVSIAYGVTIENAIGSAFADRITGNAAANRLEGRAGNDTLDGGAGADTLDGGAGSDFYVLRNTGNVMIEAANSGVDTIEAHVALGLLPANFENLVLLASGNLDVTGNALANRISGNFDDNRLDGGAGADTLEGGFGNDTYIVDNAGDRVTELLDTGSIDRVESSVSFTLGANLEQLALTESSDVNGTGNGVDNVLTGNSGANVLDGGAGADTLAGGAGDDTYIVDNAGDVVTEFSGQGRDTIVTPFETVLSTPFENLFLSGTGNVNATGNAANNVLHGNVGNNVLDGGTGMDTMDGGAGNDTYVIDRLLEQGVISDSGGVDTVISGAQYTGLASGLENLKLTGNAWYGVGNDGANAIVGTSGANVLQGGAGNDTLSGGGGADVLIGGDGADRFVFDTPLAAGNVDVVIDFSATANDRIVLDNDVFGALATLGTLAPAAFFAAAGAHEAANASEHIVLDITSGALYYDADGAGGAAAVQIALIIGTAGISAANFEIVH